MEHRWGQRTAVELPVTVRTLSGDRKNDGVIADLSISGALIRINLDIEIYNAVEVQVHREWILAWITRGLTDAIAVEWMRLAPESVVRQLEVSALHLSNEHLTAGPVPTGPTLSFI